MKKTKIAIATATLLAGTAFAGFMNTTWAGQVELNTKSIAQKQTLAKLQQNMFRDIKVEETDVIYTVKGEANVFEGNFQYVVKQGDTEITKGFGTASKGGPEWGIFSQDITISKSKLSADQTLTLELYEEDAATGEPMNKLEFPMNENGEEKGNKAFRDAKVIITAVTYAVKGEANVHEGTYHYAVKHGDKVVTQGFGTASKGGPEWGAFEQTINAPVAEMTNGTTLSLELFEIDQKTGNAIHKIAIPLTKTEEKKQAKMFRDTKVVSSSVVYTIKGEARVFEGNYNYAVKQGNKVVAKGFGTATKGGPEWGTFTQKISVPVSKLSGKQSLTIELFEIDEATGKKINSVVIPVK
ncbi:Gmad2 immunoglobulin-like domain-containing protein [Paenibacillaceae sp. P-4]|uniref:Gmad2 immunoglobulin-like domain-containing protein n=1 Tax=Paenibacillaceae bacterium P-4 TaxID=3160969 RepID=UPI0032E80674